MAHYDSGLYISHHSAENGHCGMDWDSLIMLFSVVFIFLFQASPRPNAQHRLSAQIFTKLRIHEQSQEYTSEIIRGFLGWALNSHDLNWFCTTAFLTGQ